MASSVTVFAVASVLFFIIGFLCGHFRICQCQKHKLKNVKETINSTAKKETPYYDNIDQFDIQPEHVHLEKNVAYGPVLRTNI